MKSIIKSLLAPVGLLAVLPFMASCETDTDSNPTLQQPTTFVLNTPAYAENNVYDLANAETVNLTTTQPDYGFPIATNYQVQVSLDQAFTGVTTVEVPEGISYETLADSYTQANMDVDATQLNNAIVSLYQKANDGADPSGKEIAAYIRLVAHVNGTDLGWCCSNVITLPKVVVSYIAVMPTDVYVAGPSIRGGGEPKELGAVYGNTGEWYGMVYMAAGSTLTYGDATSQASVPTTLDDQAEAGASLTDNGVTFANAGWYALYLKIAIENNSLRSALAVYPGIAAVTGNATNGFVGDAGYDATAWYLTAPADASGQWESPAFTGSGELRAYINIPGLDWWRTEFTIYNGSLYWRDADIASDWATNVGADYSVACSPGQKLYVNFDYDTAEVK